MGKAVRPVLIAKRISDGVRALALVAVVLFATAVEAQVYQWTDRSGVVYYTTDRSRIPAEYREQIRVLDSTKRDATAPRPAPDATIFFGRGTPIIAEARLNGVALKLLVDTGADRTVISPSALAKAGIAMDRARPVRIVGATGVADTLEVEVARLDVAGVQVGPLRVVAHNVAAPEMDGLLGRDVLDGFVLTIDAGRGRAILTR